ncbi:MAG: hypothetical protein KC482_09430, partial [Dehalococcoidia bacterium]|nr:hypothetical protein [Dehalococcoidia bacterium]
MTSAGPTPRRRSRRWFLGASATAAGYVVLSCGGGSTSPSPTASTGTTGTQTPPAGPTATLGPGVTPTRPPAGPPSLTMTGFVVGDGQFDPHRTQVGTLQGQQAFV